MITASARRNLLAWFDVQKRNLPWRRTGDPWAILVSEIMLQQTRVETVIPYYERFLERFPSAQDFARATPDEVLTAWAGLGYYSRARNLQRAAAEIAAAGSFPGDYDGIRKLPGVGSYTAAAVASIAFQLPHAALDGNIARVVARYTEFEGDIKKPASRAHLQQVVDRSLDRARPGDYNQALMELGAVICTPRDPRCLVCPVAAGCRARAAGRQGELPVRSAPPEKTEVRKNVVAIVRRGKLLLRRVPDDSPRLAGFWEFPEPDMLKQIEVGPQIGRFRHTIVNQNFEFIVYAANLSGESAGCRWWPLDRLHEIPLSTTAKKAVPCLVKKEDAKRPPRGAKGK